MDNKDFFKKIEDALKQVAESSEYKEFVSTSRLLRSKIKIGKFADEDNKKFNKVFHAAGNKIVSVLAPIVIEESDGTDEIEAFVRSGTTFKEWREKQTREIKQLGNEIERKIDKILPLYWHIRKELEKRNF